MFEYDFGDGWEIMIVLEKIIDTDSDISGKDLPRVLEGEGYGIIEDCGGSEGLDLGIFDLDDMNFRLKK